MKQYQILLITLALFEFGCGADKTSNQPYTEKRTVVQSAPVQVYEEKGKGADTGTLKIELFETEVSLNYRMISSYGGETWEYLITFPNLQIMPKPVLRSANEPMSVDIGFLDADDQFNAFRMVKIVNGTMVFKRLKEYQITPMP